MSVTRGSRGIGASIALECARRGLRVNLTSATTRVATAGDVARVIAPLSTGEGGWINARNIEVAGGYVI